MRWLEIITLRCTENDRLQAALELLQQMAHDKIPDAPETVHYYRNSEVENDLTVHLLWNFNVLTPYKSSLGARLAHFLRDFGLIHHAIWIEEKPASPV